MFGFNSSLNSLHQGVLKNCVGSCTTFHATFESLQKERKTIIGVKKLEKHFLTHVYYHLKATNLNWLLMCQFTILQQARHNIHCGKKSNSNSTISFWWRSLTKWDWLSFNIYLVFIWIIYINLPSNFPLSLFHLGHMGKDLLFRFQSWLLLGWVVIFN